MANREVTWFERMEPTLQDDVIVEVISRMPPRDAMKLCCLSKNWRSLISSSYFRSLHFENFTRKQSGTFLWRHLYGLGVRVRLEAFSLFKNHHLRTLLVCRRNCSPLFQIVGVINGLVCLLDENFHSVIRICIWNPIVKRIIHLPAHPFVISTAQWCSLVFAFDDTRKDYKVFDAVTYRDSEGRMILGNASIAVYSFRSKYWSLLPNSNVPEFALANGFCGAFLEGSCHWPVYGEEPGGGKVKCNLLRVRADDYSRSNLNLPEAFPMDVISDTMVSVTAGCLSLISFLWPMMGFEDISRNVWIMREYGNPSSWIIRYRIRVGINGLRGPHGTVMIRNGQIYDRTGNGNDPNGQLAEEVLLCPTTFFRHAFSESLELLDTGTYRTCFCSL